MFSLDRQRITKLELVLAALLRSRSLEEWAEYSALKLLEEAGQTVPPVRIDAHRLLALRNIRRVKVVATLPERGRLLTTGDGFEILLAPSTKNSRSWFPVVIAHELAHSLFYDISSSRPRSLIILPAGNKDLEWLCWYLASVLLMPEKWVRHFVSQRHNYVPLNQIPDEVDRLVETFQVPRQLAATRAIHCLGLLKCIILRFEKSIDNSRADSSWKLVWHTRPKEAMADLYIPFSRRRLGKITHPRCKPPIRDFIVECENSQVPGASIERAIDLDDIKCSTLGNLPAFLERTMGRKHLAVVGRIAVQPWMDLFSPSDAYDHKIFELYIPLAMDTD